MLNDYEMYQGVVLRQIILGVRDAVSISPLQSEGRVRGFLLDGEVAVLIKHSSKRLTPWVFTFHPDNIDEISEIRSAFSKSFISLVCGSDGVATLSLEDLQGLFGQINSGSAWIRLARMPRLMYTVSGSGCGLDRKLAQGTGPVNEALRIN